MSCNTQIGCSCEYEPVSVTPGCKLETVWEPRRSTMRVQLDVHADDIINMHILIIL